METLLHPCNRGCTASATNSSYEQQARILRMSSLCKWRCAAATTSSTVAAAVTQSTRTHVVPSQQTAVARQAAAVAAAGLWQRWRSRTCAVDHRQGATAADLNPTVYLDPSAHPNAFLGPIQAVHIPGKGRGLVATQPLKPGQLLLVTPPIALVEGNLGEIPDHEELQEVIASSGATFTSWQADWLAALITSTGDTGSSSSSSSNSGAHASSNTVVIPDMMPPEGGSRWYMPDINAAAAAAETRIPFESFRMSDEQLWAAVVLNCYGEAFQDLPATLCSGAELCSQLGLWGPFSLLNHSCCPNAVNYTLRDSMVVRAATAVEAGEEVCINYLGRGALRPLSQRQQDLQLSYGFKCDCPRCRLEASVAASAVTANGLALGRLLDSIMEKLPDYEVQLQTALAGISECSIVAHQHPTDAQQQNNHSTDAQQQQQQQQIHGADSTDSMQLVNCTRQLTDLVADMQQQWQALKEALRSSSSSSSGRSSISSTGGLLMDDLPTAVAWIEASAFDLLGLLQEAAAAAAAATPATKPSATADSVMHGFDQLSNDVVASMLHVCETVCPGSDLHVFNALRWTSKLQLEGGENSGAAGAAYDRLLHALKIRYGCQIAANEQLMKGMVQACSSAAAMVSF